MQNVISNGTKHIKSDAVSGKIPLTLIHSSRHMPLKMTKKNPTPPPCLRFLILENRESGVDSPLPERKIALN